MPTSTKVATLKFPGGGHDPLETEGRCPEAREGAPGNRPFQTGSKWKQDPVLWGVSRGTRTETSQERQSVREAWVTAQLGDISRLVQANLGGDDRGGRCQTREASRKRRQQRVSN